MALAVVQHTTPYQTRAAPRRPPLGLVLHNTVTTTMPVPRPGVSWHYAIDRDGSCHQWVDDLDYAWHVRACDRWQPAWMRARDPRVSTANSCTVGIELVSWMGASGVPVNYVPYTLEQYVTLGALFETLYGRYGPLPVVTHGLLQSDRTDPVGFDFGAASLVWRDDGYRYEPQEVPDVSPEDQAILDVMHGLGANAASIEGWINQIGALESEVTRLAAELDACEATVAQGPPVPVRVEVTQANGRVDGFVPEG